MNADVSSIFSRMGYALLVAVAAGSLGVTACNVQSAATVGSAETPDGAATAEASNVMDQSNPIEADASVEGLDDGGASPDAIATDVDAGPGSAICRYPAGVEAAGDAANHGCFAAPSGQSCQVSNGATVLADGAVLGGTEDCSAMCPGAHYEVTCRSASLMGSIPDPDSTLGCTVIPIPTPSDTLFYCCPCVGAGDASDSGATVEASDATDGSSAADACADVDSGSCTALPTSTEDAGTLILQAFGGASGEVAAQVPLLEPGVGQEQTCTDPLDAGACQLTSCTLGGVGSPGMGYGNFGPMSASVGTTIVPLTYGGFGYPTVYFPSSVTLGTGGTMTFHGGNGVSIPTFDVAATIPGLAVITSPVPETDGGAAIIDTSQDLTVTWVPISIGQIHFTLSAGYEGVMGGGLAVTVACTFGGSAGAGVVPRTLLSSFMGMSGTSPTYAGIESELDETTTVDGLTIVTQSYQNSPTTSHDFDVTLQ
jgi:hypothetical protein